MKSNKYISNIRNYSVISFLLPLITIILCLFLYKFLGNAKVYSNYNFKEKKIEYTLKEYNSISKNIESYSFTNCPINKYSIYMSTTDNKIITYKNEDDSLIEEETAMLIENSLASNQIKSVIINQGKTKNNRCVKNNKFIYLLFINFNTLEKFFIKAKKNNASGFGKVINPYLYGEVSISRTARYFPGILIFKPLIILSAIFLILYWKNNLNLFNEFRNKNILSKFSKKFFYLGVISCIFLILHASFLGLDFDSKLFSKIRKLIIILFIFFEVLAQIFLTTNLIKFKKDIKNYINPLILNIKIVFVSLILFITCLVFILLIWGDLSSSVKHILEWNYFSCLLVYYALSRLLWKKKQTQVHTPEGV